MSMSAFFRALRPSYQAEMDDLTFDSEGRNVLRKRLLEKRSQVVFLRQMMEVSPEMVAVVFHGGFHFELPAVMEHVLTLESDEFPEWHSLAEAVQLTPWAQELADSFLQEPQGDWFMTVAAALEYLFQRPSTHHHDDAAHDEHTEDAPSGTKRRGHEFDFDKDDEHDRDHDHEEASAQWLEDQGFDRKE
ncbi:hypothetical protein MIZ03_0475 [Rhodoferax lithotrophicus]|uniref:Uncharacterized protein n=1 Tax=Rhodoferax lithotrophicus TaxID=2798804 RepID=A0ABN6D0Z0_9BURK|nr:hypothetical protein [Rhodoferax sp. MIZ03]BCO25612.1 hypothetical protein MIZ03_0475 [Rhodoferax sp. MIZ03]